MSSPSEAQLQVWKSLYDMGFSIFPATSKGKRPLVQWEPYQHCRAPFEKVREWARSTSNIAVATGPVSDLIVLDLDSSAAIATARQEGLLETVTVRTGRGLHAYYRYPGYHVGNRVGIFPGADIRADGAYVIGPGSCHENGTSYEWDNPPELFGIAPYPEQKLRELEAKRGASPAAPAHRPAQVRPPMAASAGGDRRAKWIESALEGELARVRQATKGGRNAALNRAAMALGQLGSFLDEAATRGQLLAAAEASGLLANDGERACLATIASGWEAGLATPRNGPPERPAERQRPVAAADNDDGADGEFSEDGVALAFAEKFKSRLLYDHTAGCWFEWDGFCWRRDGTARAFSYARHLVRLSAEGKARNLKASVCGGVERMARSDQRLAVEGDIWDRDIFKLGVPGNAR